MIFVFEVRVKEGWTARDAMEAHPSEEVQRIILCSVNYVQDFVGDQSRHLSDSLRVARPRFNDILVLLQLADT